MSYTGWEAQQQVNAYWKTRDGQRLLVADMGTDHLINARNLLQRKIALMQGELDKRSRAAVRVEAPSLKWEDWQQWLTVTEWFPGTTNPVNIGVYECVSVINGRQYWKRWDGFHWHMGCKAYDRARQVSEIFPAPRQWRGVNEKLP